MVKSQLIPESYIAPSSRYGMLRSATPTGDVWLYAAIPQIENLMGGTDNQHRIDAKQQLQHFFEGLAALVPHAAMQRRDMLKRYYREIHLLTSSMSVRYRPPRSERGTLIGEEQSYAYGDYFTRKQFAVIGVKLIPSGRATKHDRHKSLLTRIMDWFDSVAFSIANGCQPFEDYLEDEDIIESIMSEAGLRPFSRMDATEFEHIRNQMETWWVSRPTSNGLPIIAEYDHVHFFPNEGRCQDAKNKYNRDVDCVDWNIDGEYPATVCALKSTSFNHTPIENPSSLWIANLMASARGGGASAMAVSVRGIVEPAKVTAQEIRRNKRTLDETVGAREEKGHDATGDMLDAQENLHEGNDLYRLRSVPPTLTETSVFACVAGRADRAARNLEYVPYVDFVALNSANQQLMAFKSMQACSDVRLIPYERHLSSTCLSGGGAGSLAVAGDDDGALVGFTEANRQPVYVGPSIASVKDKRPAMLIIGDTASGKSMLMTKLCYEWSLINTPDGKRTPVILFNPKKGNDFEDAVTAVGGTVVRLDSEVANGTFDPFNVIPNQDEALQTATTMIADILKMSNDSVEDELAVSCMLKYGLSRGMQCCGTMVACAARDYLEYQRKGVDPEHLPDGNILPANTLAMADKIRRALSTNQFLRLIFGTEDGTKPLRVSEGWTLVNAGNRNIMPEPNSRASMTGRIQQWAMFMIVMGSFSAVEERDGVVAVDEAWSILDPDSPTCALIDQKLRTARSMRVTPVFASQKVKEFIGANMVGGFSRAFLLSMSDTSDEKASPARLALKLLDIRDENDVILNRMRADAEKDNGDPNWSSLKALYNSGTRDNIRGSVAYFIDGEKQPTPIEIVIPPDLLRKISTNAIDKRNRLATHQQVA